MKPYRHQMPQICDNHHSFISIRMNDTHSKFNVGIDCVFENICLKHRTNFITEATKSTRNWCVSLHEEGWKYRCLNVEWINVHETIRPKYKIYKHTKQFIKQQWDFVTNRAKAGNLTAQNMNNALKVTGDAPHPMEHMYHHHHYVNYPIHLTIL